SKAMFLPASLIISCFLIQDCMYLSARLALSSSDGESWVIKSRSDRYSTLSSTAAKTASSTCSPSVLNLNRSQLERKNDPITMSKLLFNHHLGYSFLFTLINLNHVIFF